VSQPDFVDRMQVDGFERRSLMDDVWRQMHSVGMVWGAMIDARNAMSGYERSIRQGYPHEVAAERALNLFAGPRAH